MATTTTSHADPRETVLITGCSSGIGLALSHEFHSLGYRVIATARNTRSLTSLAALGIETLPLELTSKDSLTALHTSVQQLTNGRGLNYLVNNAGRNMTVPALDLDIDDVRDMFEGNVFAVMRLCQLFAPELIKAKGTIVMLGSLSAVMPYVFGSAYNASKAALHEYADTLRVELAPFNVSVITLITGGVKSNVARLSRELPANSLYRPVNDEYQARLTHSQTGAGGGMPADIYARSVVRQVTGARKPMYVWEGNKSWMVWFLHWFLPGWVKDTIFTRMFKLWKLRGTQDSAKMKST